MKSDAYVRVLLKWWWLVLAVTALTLVATAVFLAGQPRVYESSATFVVKPRTAAAEELVRAIDTLSRRVEINSTYADISESKLVRQRAVEQLGLSSDDRKGLNVTSRVVAGTNILEITGRASRPETASDFTAAVANATLVYIGDLGDVFTLQALDPPSMSGKPTSPKVRSTMMLGAFLGLALGCGLALAADYVWREREIQVGTPVEAASNGDGRTSDREGNTSDDQSAASDSYSAAEDGFTVAVYTMSAGEDSLPDDSLELVADDADGWLSEEDVTYRLNGDQIAVLFQASGQGQIDARVEQYRAALEQAFKQRGADRVSIDVGVAYVPDEGAWTEEGVEADRIISVAQRELAVAVAADLAIHPVRVSVEDPPVGDDAIDSDPVSG